MPKRASHHVIFRLKKRTYVAPVYISPDTKASYDKGHHKAERRVEVVALESLKEKYPELRQLKEVGRRHLEIVDSDKIKDVLKDRNIK